MQNTTRLLIALLLAAGSSFGGEAVVVRKEFKQSAGYPFVFKAAGYLATVGPLPMRFAEPRPACGDRNPPPLLPGARAPKSEQTAAEAKAESAKPEHPENMTPSFPPPADAPAGKQDGHDFSKVPDEVLEYFKNTEGRPVRRDYLFDPIFQPAMPHELPKSKTAPPQK